MSDNWSLLVPAETEELRVAVRDFLATRAPWQEVLARTEEPGTDNPLWSGLARELGVVALPLSETLGGQDATWNEAAIVAEELGRVVADVPFLTNSIATALLWALGADELLTDLAGGTQFAVATTWTDTLQQGRDYGLVWDGATVSGFIPVVAGVFGSAHLIVPANGALVIVDTGAVTGSRVVSFDMTRPLSDLTFDKVPGRELASGTTAADALAHAGRIGAALLASEQLGLAEQSLEIAVAYVKERRQFGRQIGSFQAIKHRLADLWTEVIAARAVARYAAVCAAESSDDLPTASSLAQVVCSRLAQHAAEELVQMHGGIGFTWDNPAHLYLKRARVDAMALGDPAWHRENIATLAGI